MQQVVGWKSVCTEIEVGSVEIEDGSVENLKVLLCVCVCVCLCRG